jgi:hypothetical protein
VNAWFHRVAGSSPFAETSLRVRVLDAAAGFVVTSALSDGQYVDDLPEMIARVADRAPSRLIADIRASVAGRPAQPRALGPERPYAGRPASAST